MPSALPYMRLYVNDYLGDTTHLSDAESGAYLHLLFYYWQHGELPNDERLLRRVARTETRNWKRTFAILRTFFYVDGPLLKNKRMESELERVKSLRTKAAQAGRRSGEARKAGTNVERTLNERSSGVPPGEQLQSNHPSELRTQNSEEEKNTKRVSSQYCPPAAPSDGGRAEHERRFRDEFWPLVPRKVKPTMALKAWHRHVRPEHVADCIQAVILWAERVKGRDGDKIEHPSTWLNNGWRDEFTNEKPKPAEGNGNGKQFKSRSERNVENLRGIAQMYGFGPGEGDPGGGDRVESLRLLGAGHTDAGRDGVHRQGLGRSDRPERDSD